MSGQFTFFTWPDLKLSTDCKLKSMFPLRFVFHTKYEKLQSYARHSDVKNQDAMINACSLHLALQHRFVWPCMDVAPPSSSTEIRWHLHLSKCIWLAMSTSGPPEDMSVHTCSIVVALENNFKRLISKAIYLDQQKGTIYKLMELKMLS